MVMPGREYQAGTGLYRYGFNGKENDNEVKGQGNQQDYGMRIYDTRLGRFLSVDPITKDFPWYTPYQFAGNTPIQAIDLDGEEEKHYTLTLNKNGSATLTNIPSKTKEYNDIPLWLRILTLGAGKSKEKIEPRAVVTYGSNTYKIGFASSITNQDKMGVFNEILKNSNTVDPDVFTSTFHNEGQDASVAWFTWGVNMQNNTAMYGPLTSKAWYTPKEEYASDIQQTINKATTRVAARIGGMRDRNSGSYKAYLFGSRNNGTNNVNSDQDLLILTENPSYFGSERGAKILQSIKTDYKASTGLDLDVNVMTSQQYNRAKGGEFKKSVEANKTEIKVK